MCRYHTRQLQIITTSYNPDKVPQAVAKVYKECRIGKHCT